MVEHLEIKDKPGETSRFKVLEDKSASRQDRVSKERVANNLKNYLVVMKSLSKAEIYHYE